jgi:SAM-dependent methyltransferase
MFTRSAAFYDALYGAKDYAAEAERIGVLHRTHGRIAGTTLLDVACGTGGHLAFLKQQHAAEGLDLDPNLLAIARERHPELRFHQADMVGFDLGRTFDVVVCLFSAIGYVVTVERLHVALDHVDQPVLGYVQLQRPVPLGLRPAMGARRARAGQHRALVSQQFDEALGRGGLKAARTGATVQTWQQRKKSPFGEAYS